MNIHVRSAQNVGKVWTSGRNPFGSIWCHFRVPPAVNNRKNNDKKARTIQCHINDPWRSLLKSRGLAPRPCPQPLELLQSTKNNELSLLLLRSRGFAPGQCPQPLVSLVGLCCYPPLVGLLVYESVMNTREHGIPQSRPRLYIVGVST